VHTQAAAARLAVAANTDIRFSVDFTALPGGDLIADGLADLEQGRDTIAAFLVSIGAPRLRMLGYIPRRTLVEPEQRLYELLARTEPDAAHGRYNALVRRLVSFERAAACAR
jgi:hypothetical protein